MIELTVKQQERMDLLAGMPGTRVVGVDDGCPVVSYSNGRMMKVSRVGRLVSVGKRAKERIVRAQIARVSRGGAA